MRINGDTNLDAVGRTSTPRRGGDGANVFRLEEGQQAERPATAAAASALSGVEALIALQGIGSATEAGARLRHGHDMLDLLDDIRIGLLSGDIPTAELGRLVDHLNRRPARIDGEAVEQVLDEIELRARVELAKLGKEVA